MRKLGQTPGGASCTACGRTCITDRVFKECSGVGHNHCRSAVPHSHTALTHEEEDDEDLKLAEPAFRLLRQTRGLFYQLDCNLLRSGEWQCQI